MYYDICKSLFVKDIESPDCQCPCLPKCCPEGEVLKLIDYDHGVQCVPGSVDHHQIRVTLLDDLKDIPSNGHKFYSNVFPACEGLPREGWKYEMYTQFNLSADVEEEYLLYTYKNGEKTV